METVAKNKPNIEVVSDAENLASRCVDLFVFDAIKSIKAKGVFRVAISGGHTPQRFFELLGEQPDALSLAWDKIHLFWVDERYVPVDSQWSNYKLAADTFINKVPIDPENIHRIPTESSDFKIAAASYEQTITEVFDLEPGHLPQFDMVVLGMGVEGHTGSLFPNSFASLDKEDLVLELAENGCVLEYDLFGSENSYYPWTIPVEMPNDARRLGWIERLVAHGFGDRIVISHDICFKHQLARYGGHGYAHIPTNVVPLMRRKGFDEETIRTILVDTPARLLTFAGS